MVHLAYQGETGTTQFGSEYLLLAKEPKIALKLSADNETVKDKLIFHLQAYNDRGVFGNSSRNVLASAPKLMFMPDFVGVLEGAGVKDLEFMIFGMKLRDVDSPESNAICVAVRKQWKKLDRDARNEPDSPSITAPRTSLVDVAIDCGWMDGIVMISGKDRRLRSNNMAADSSTVKIHQLLTGVSDTKIGSAEIKPPFPANAGDLNEHLKKVVMYSIHVRYIKGAVSASLGIPKRVYGMRLLFCSVARIIWRLAAPGVMDCLGGMRTELRVSGQETPKSALRYVQRHFSRLHLGRVLEKVGGHADDSDNVNVHIVPPFVWLGNLVKMLLKFKEECVGSSDADLNHDQKVACADLISALGISNRDTERYATEPIKDLDPYTATEEEFPWFWTDPEEAEPAATIAAGEEIDWRVPKRPSRAPKPPSPPDAGEAQHGPPLAPNPNRGQAGEAQHGPPLANNPNRGQAMTRLNVPRRSAPVVMEELRTRELRRMRKEVKWYRPRRGGDASSRLYRRRGHGGHGTTNLTVNQACMEIWERYGPSWREEIILRGPDEDINIPAGH